MKWLITGGCGFIGTNLIRHLIAEGGHQIRVVDNLAVGGREDLRKVCEINEVDRCQFLTERKKSDSNSEVRWEGVQLIVGDITDELLSQNLPAGADIVVHLAANTGVGPSVTDPRTDCIVNVIGTFNYLEGARRNEVKRFVFASSGAPLGEQNPPLHEEMAPHPVSPYGASKLSGEGYCSAYCRTYGLETVVLRFSNVYGPGSTHKNSVVAKFIKQAIDRQPLEVYGDGSQTRDFIFIDDLVSAILLSAKKEGIGGELFQIATNVETSINQLRLLLLNTLESIGIREVSVSHGGIRQGDVRRNFSDSSKARRVLEWEPKTELSRGLMVTSKFFKSAMQR